MKRNGSYAPLSAHYYKDDSIARAGERAELLYVRGLAFCAETLSDGFITDTQLRMFVGAGLNAVPARAKQLVAVGLWERVDDGGLFDCQGSGYLVVGWTKWNLTKAQIREKQRKDAERKADKRP